MIGAGPNGVLIAAGHIPDLPLPHPHPQFSTRLPGKIPPLRLIADLLIFFSMIIDYYLKY